MKRDPALASIRTLGFVSHVHTDLIDAARGAGIDEVMARSAFAGQLADILRGARAPAQLLTTARRHPRGRPAHRAAASCARLLRHSPWLSAAAGGDVFLKLETLQPTFSYKIRGAFNAVLKLVEERGGRRRPLVTASAGNHGRALAHAARAAGLR